MSQWIRDMKNIQSNIKLYRRFGGSRFTRSNQSRIRTARALLTAMYVLWALARPETIVAIRVSSVPAVIRWPVEDYENAFEAGTVFARLELHSCGRRHKVAKSY